MGTCILGHDPIDSCEHFLTAEADLNADHGDDVETLDPGDEFDTPGQANGVPLQSNRAITENDITEFRGRFHTKTIVLVGEQKAGKTTLLATIFGLFCAGPVGRFSFAGSQTLLAFAERRHLALEKSKRVSPSTPRTSRADPVSFFHLCLSDSTSNNPTNLIISDRSGEAYDDARKNTQLIDKLVELRMADIVCFLLDAGKLTDLETRAGYKRKFRETIRALVDNEALTGTAEIEVLITKLDKLQRKDVEPSLADDLASYENELRREFGSRIAFFDIHRICALPRANMATGVVGLVEMVERWCAPDPQIDTRPKPIADAARHFDRLVEVWAK
ncbi:TRAFAC clade GTPase domain-containing protein [Rhizobium sp. PL01]|uniref:TRAFAC clade GTPase domain-containing protein n=1 Tax=Rhizobium sp. PL01 TaxID=3085631 RepID=UPI002981E3AB|nr:hypothetical protein [Rhizobium sp. PL01]MDW5312994.1 hypothetical protein [Rhizobium sp. PL01]